MTHDRSDQPRRRKYQTIQSDVEGYTRIKHVYIPMRDGVELCANIFLPFSASKHGEKVPVICTLGAYGKDVHATKFGLPNTPMYSQMFKHIRPLGPDACFELCEPMIWVCNANRRWRAEPLAWLSVSCGREMLISNACLDTFTVSRIWVCLAPC
ncbi:hypothetical protein VTO42DRAFT_7203 [Malbranchea cinnamomea]